MPPRTEHAKASSQTLYLVSAGDAFKVGVANHPSFRVEKMQSANARELKLEGYFYPWTRTAREVEKEWHERLSQWNIRGEWFQLVPEALTEIEYLILEEIQREIEAEKAKA